MIALYHTRATYVRKIADRLGLSAWYANTGQVRIRRGVATYNVNWGCGLTRLALFPVNDLPTLNADISGSTSKLETFRRLDRAALPHPTITLDPNELHEDGRRFYELGRYLGRRDGLSGGRGIVVYEQGQRPPEGVTHDFYSKIVTKAYEVRIHIWRGDIICEQFKFVPQGSRVLIRNRDNGARFSVKPITTHIDSDVAAIGRDLAIRSVAACGLDFAAVDMALTNRGRWVIFELNSAPGITQRESDDHATLPDTYEAYSSRFQTVLREV